jgi:DNA replication protein DnaC
MGKGIASMDKNMQHMGDILKAAMDARADLPRVPPEPPRAVCPRCHGAGYLRYDVPADDPRFSELIMCDCTRAELETKRRQQLEKRSLLVGDLETKTFESWSRKFPEGKAPKDSADAAFRIARMYAEDPHTVDKPWLFLFGSQGTGKTHLAAAVAHKRIALGQPAIFMNVPDLLMHLRRAFSPTSDVTHDDLFESLRTTPMLILDDIGRQLETKWAQEKMYQLINHRYNLRLPTVITMNEDAEEIDPVIWSRINDIRLTIRCDVFGDDQRTTTKQPVKAPRPGQQRRGKVRDEYRV